MEKWARVGRFDERWDVERPVAERVHGNDGVALRIHAAPYRGSRRHRVEAAIGEELAVDGASMKRWVARFEAREGVEIAIQPRVDEVCARVRVAQVATTRTSRIQKQHAPLFGLRVGDAHASEVEFVLATEVQLQRRRQIAFEIIGQLEIDVYATEQRLREMLFNCPVQEKA